MMEDVYKVMNRVNEIQARFNIMNKSVRNPESTGATFQQSLNTAAPAKNRESIPEINFRPEATEKITREQIVSLTRTLAQEQGVPSGLVDSMIEAESSYDQNAVSPKGAMGLMQLMPETAMQNGVTNPLSPEDNIRGGVRIIKNLLNRYNGDYAKALAAYNAGEGAVDRAHGVPPYKETQEYVNKVISSYLKHQ